MSDEEKRKEKENGRLFFTFKQKLNFKNQSNSPM